MPLSLLSLLRMPAGATPFGAHFGELALDFSQWEDHTQLAEGVVCVTMFLVRFLTRQMSNTKIQRSQVALICHFYQKHIADNEEITQKKKQIAIATGYHLELFKEEEI